MGIALRKDIIVRLPMPLYQEAKKISDGEYKLLQDSFAN